MKIKVCGMRDQENIIAISALNPDYMGFIFYKDSPRFAGDHFVMPANLPATIQRVGVFVNSPVEEIIRIVNTHYLHLVQLHGDESVEDVILLRDSGIRVMKVFSVGNDFDFGTTLSYSDHVDFFLFDTKGNQRGGNGAPFDWTLLRRYTGGTPFFLSGGLSEQNIGGVEMLQHPALVGVDLNSGVETAPGIKSAIKIERIKKIISKK